MPTITKITVRAGRTVPHPLHQFGNLKADVELVAELDAGEDAATVQRELQQQIESDIEQHVSDLKDSLRDLAAFHNSRAKIKRLEAETARLQEEKARLEEELIETVQEMPLFARQQLTKPADVVSVKSDKPSECPIEPPSVFELDLDHDPAELEFKHAPSVAEMIESLRDAGGRDLDHADMDEIG